MTFFRSYRRWISATDVLRAQLTLAPPSDEPRAAALAGNAAPAIAAVLGSVLLAISTLVGQSLYNSDSWATFELARTVFSGDFYHVNTLRSYWSESYSASFPLGFPVLLAVGQLLVGEDPMLAVWVNIAAALATWLLVPRVCAQLRLSPLLGVALATSLLCWPFYLDEVLRGGTTPVALLAFVGGCRAGLAGWPLANGILLGCAALIRFDYLAFGIVYQAAALLIWRGRDARWLLLLPAGFLLGLSPWLIYSLVHFGRWWASDNSWIALSAAKAYVTDFPAAAHATVFDAPWQWFARVVGNAPPMLRVLVSASLRWPLAPVLALLFLLGWRQHTAFAHRPTMALAALLCAASGPYLLTGYFAQRYFTLLLLAACALLAHAVESAPLERLKPADYGRLIIGAIVAAGGLAVFHLAQVASDGIRDVKGVRSVADQIEIISKCHAATPDVRYIFAGPMSRLRARYGAVTGLPTAFLPGNFQRMTTTERARYFEAMRPYVFVDAAPDPGNCFTPVGERLPH